MVRRPPFEEANYHATWQDHAQWIVLAIVIAGLAVAAAFSYNYWWVVPTGVGQLLRLRCKP